jgi:hypothetical protein
MASPEQLTSASSSDSESITSQRTDFLSAIAWMALGIAILIGSVMMDRLEDQDINPYTIPGLLPGLLGIVMTILGALLALRSWRPGILTSTPSTDHSADHADYKRLLLVLGLCLIFGVVLIGHGLPFWLAGAIFVTASILSLQYQQRKSSGQGMSIRSIATATAIGVGAGLAITIVFQDLFLVHLP